MPRFFVNASQISSNLVTITGDDVKHISKVLRLKCGDTITVCDGKGTDYLCSISSMAQDSICADISTSLENTAEPPIFITIYQGLPKSDKMDYIVQKCVELGASRIVPTITKRVVSRPRDIDKKIVRWQKIAAEAAKQCGRGIIPQIGQMTSFEEAVLSSSKSGALNIMPYEDEKNSKLKAALNGCDKAKNNYINLFIGSEGGFEQSEAEFALKNGAKAVTLGPRILRTETAPVAACAAVMYELGDW